ncbi:hypothetical protein PUR61_03770 [Streptomyces sp. BE20]|nr:MULTISPECIES: hypothetical protein [unclassified Streptomyces]MED7948830.1 hypothetical protein [Streptomyces sp. BE303]MEE1821319.1 hypothetical protein [Streptomyces sp. BE20]
MSVTVTLGGLRHYIEGSWAMNEDIEPVATEELPELPLLIDLPGE